MGAKSVGELGQSGDMDGLYAKDYPLYIPGAPYPGPTKRLKAPAFAVGMNSRLQRKNDADIKLAGRYEQIQEPSKTVVLLERGLPKDKKTMPAQGGFSGSPKANPRAFAARRNQKGTLISPQTSIVWTLNPDDDPN